jgi:hypothetical protein
LSIQQPWTYLLAHGIKDIENRTWSTTYRGPILLHAGKVGDAEYFSSKNKRFYYGIWTSRWGVKVARFAYDYQFGGIVGIADLVDVVTTSASPWFCPGQYGFVFEHAQPLDFIVFRGALGLFPVPFQKSDGRVYK